MNTSPSTIKPLALLAALLVSSFCGLSMAKPAPHTPSLNGQITIHDIAGATRNEVPPGDVAPAPTQIPVQPTQPRPAPARSPEPPAKAHPGCPDCP